MLCLRSSRVVSRSMSLLLKRRLTPLPPSTRCVSSHPSISLPTLPQPDNLQYPSRAFTILSSHRPRTLSQSLSASASSSFPTPPSSSTALTTLDLLPKISLHPVLANIQVRNGPRDTFNPSHRVRKRRHGFLSRLRTRTGRMTLKRRRLKRRSTLSH